MSSHNNTPTLFAMATRNAIRNVDQIESIGDIPFDMVEPILKQIKSPQQLRELEENSPHVKAHSKSLWLAFIRRDIPRSEQNMMTPKNPLNWGGIYRYMLKQDQKLKQEQEEILKKEMLGLHDKREKSTFLPQVVKQAAVQRNFFDGNPNPNKRHNSWSAPRIPTTKNAKSGQFIAALKKEAQDAQAARASAARHAKGEKTRFIPSAKAQIKTAPYDMLANHQKPKASDALLRSVKLDSSAQRRPDIFAPSFTTGRVSAKDRALDEAEARERRMKEDRLRALANPSTKPIASSVSTIATSPINSPSSNAVQSARSTAAPAVPSKRYALSTPAVRRNPAPGTTVAPSAQSPPATTIASTPRDALNPKSSTAGLTTQGRPIASAKPRLSNGVNSSAGSPSKVNAPRSEDLGSGIKQSTKSGEESAISAPSMHLPIIRKRAPAKLFIDHASKRIKR
nr:elongin-a [Quercus suber]